MMKTLFSFLICMSLTSLPEAFAKAGGACPTQQLLSACNAGGAMAGFAGGGALGGGGGMQGPTADAGARTAQSSAAFGNAASQCRVSASQCAACTNPQQRQQCEQAVNGAANGLQAQSAGLGGDASSLLSAAAMMGAAMIPMLMKKDEEEQQQQQQAQQYEGALRPDGTIDCAKNDAYKYSACDRQMSATCKNAMSDVRCIAFANRYCNSSGAGDQYCNTVVAYQFCSQSGTSQCPSCLQLQADTSSECSADPAKCVFQPSPEIIEGMRAKCPTDPLYIGSSGTAIANNGAPAVTSPNNPAVNPNLAAPILPVSVSGSQGSSGSIASAGGTGQVSVMSAGGGQQLRDAKANNPTASTASSTGGSYSPSSVIGAPDRMAAVRKTASSGPTSDISGQYSQSVFSTNSQVIRAHCVAGRYKNCP
jgi:hypothetical protein